MPKTDSGDTSQSALLNSSNACELIPEIVSHDLLELIELMDAGFLGAEHQERCEDRLGYCNDYQPFNMATQDYGIELMIHKLRTGTYLPTNLKPRLRLDRALYGVVMKVYVDSISTRKVDALVTDLGVQTRISRSLLSRICADIDVRVQHFLNHSLEGVATFTTMPPTCTAAFARPCRSVSGLCL
jgi:putative transposase